MSEHLSRAQIRELINNHIARDLARTDPAFIEVARSARAAQVRGAYLAASIGAAINGAGDLPISTGLVIDHNRLIGIAERVEGFTEVPTMALAGHRGYVARPTDRDKPVRSIRLVGLADDGDED